MVFILLSSGEVKIVCCCVKKDYTNKDNSKSFKNLKHNRQEIKDIMSLIFKAFEFWCVWGYGKREKKVAGADSCITTRPYTAEVVQCLCLWLHKRLRVRDVDHLSVNNFSRAAWDSLLCLLYYPCCFSTLFLSQQAWNVTKQNLGQNNHSHTSNRLRVNFLISFNVENTREPHVKELTGNAGSEPTPAMPFLYFLKLWKIAGLWRAYVLYLKSLI